VAPDVAVIGLGRVGLPLALSFADRGLSVVGVDRRQGVLDSLAAGAMPFHETGTPSLRPPPPSRSSGSGAAACRPRCPSPTAA